MKDRSRWKSALGDIGFLFVFIFLTWPGMVVIFLIWVIYNWAT